MASTITALEGSVTRPVREAFVDWARRAEVNEARESSRRAVIALLGSVGLHPEPEAIAVAPIFVAPFRNISEDSRQPHTLDSREFPAFWSKITAPEGPTVNSRRF